MENEDPLVALIKSAFPHGDLAGHNEYHKKIMQQEEEKRIAAEAKAVEDKRIAGEKAEERKAIVLEVKKKVIAGTVWAIVLVALSIAADKLFGIHLS